MQEDMLQNKKTKIERKKHKSSRAKKKSSTITVETPIALTREAVIAAAKRDPTGKELASLLTLHGIGVPIETNPTPRPDPFRPLPDLFRNAL
jgi:hypothetical protein